MVASTSIVSALYGPPRESTRGGSVQSGWRSAAAVAALFVLCIVTRLVTTIHYVEDPDSLRFALAMIDFDVSRMQPHFPGYIVFVGVARILTSLAGSFATGFALAGALATFMATTGMLSLLRWPLLSGRGFTLALLMLSNGMLWLYGNRYMPDLLGTALLIWALRDILSDDVRPRMRGAFGAAMLAGTRLSYMPFLLPAAAIVATWRAHRAAAIVVFAIGIALWSSSLVGTMGWQPLVDTANRQTSGHFDQFGGTIRTEPNVARRAVRMVDGIWTDALGGYSTGRSWITLVVGAGSLVAMSLSISGLRKWLRHPRSRVITAGIVCYVIWIFFFQNVVHHSRHLLPLVPFLLAAIAYGLHRLASMHLVGAALALMMLIAMATVGGHLAWQHRQPVAIAQVRNALALAPESVPLTVVSTDLVNHYLSSTGVRARFISVESSVKDSLEAGARVVSVGDYRSLIERPVRSRQDYYHNPHVNRIWSHIEVYEYESAGVP